MVFWPVGRPPFGGLSTRLQQCRAVIACLAASLCVATASAADFMAELVFPLHDAHNHAPGIVECPNGDLLVSWYRGSGERKADDVAVYGAWKRQGQTGWSDPFVMADYPGFPDCNTCLMMEPQGRLWLFWPVIVANSWESAITHYRSATDWSAPGTPRWDRQGIVLMKPDEQFAAKAKQALDDMLKVHVLQAAAEELKVWDLVKGRVEDKLLQRLGWQPRCKPTVLPSGRILLPLYSDTYSASLMAISDDQGQTWYASQPIFGCGNIQPTVLRRRDGSLVTYMRENGWTKHIRMSESRDEGLTWSPVTNCDLPNPGAGIDAVALDNGHWVMVYNDTTEERNQLAVSLSLDEGKTWPHKRYLEKHPQGSYHYPVIIAGAHGRLHCVYSYFVEQGKSMKYASFDEAWILQAE